MFPELVLATVDTNVTLTCRLAAGSSIDASVYWTRDGANITAEDKR